MRCPIWLQACPIFVGWLTLAAPLQSSAQSPPIDRVRLRFDTAEAVAVLAIVDSRHAGHRFPETDWQPLLSAEGYQRLKAREAAMQRAFTDSAFSAFVLSASRP